MLFQLILKNFATGHVVRVDRHIAPADREVAQRIAAARNDREQRVHRNVKWTVRQAAS